MNESSFFFKALPDKRLVKKVKLEKCDKKSKQRFTIAFFVKTVEEKEKEPVVTRKSGVPRCFRGLRDLSRPANVH